MDRLSAYKQAQQSSRKKKPNYAGLYVMGAAVLLLLIVFWASTRPANTNSMPSKQQQGKEFTADVNLSAAQKMKIYASLMNRKEMLRPVGAVNRAYETLALENHLTVQQVQSIEYEGMSKRWPR